MLEKNSGFKLKHKCPKMEQLEDDKEYSFTYSPEEVRDLDTYRTKNDVTPFEDLRAKIRVVEARLKKTKFCSMSLYWEFSPTGRLHAHGNIYITSIMGFVYHDLYILQKNAVYEIDTIENSLTWDTYCHKQSHLWAKWCEDMNISYPFKIGNL